MQSRVRIALLEAGLMMASTLASGAVATDAEMALTRRWAAARFAGGGEPAAPEPGLTVLANHDPLQLNSRNGRPMQLGDRQYDHGLYCHAVSQVLVRLPQPGKTFTATVGVDLNENTQGGCGSVVFSVTVKGAKVFASDVMRAAMPAIPVQVDLAGATEVLLEVGDAGDGISCDQADWADAKAILADGTEIWLADLPVLQPASQAFGTEPPFSFIYDGKPFAETRGTWAVQRSSQPMDGGHTAHTLVYTDPATGLVARCEAVEFGDFPALEWVVRFENTGKADTPILEGIQALDAVLPLPGIGQVALHWSKGGVATFEDFAPQSATLAVGADRRLTADEGRSSSNVLPFFNLEAQNGGTIVALGWSGDWTATVANRAEGLTLTAGMTRTHLLLHPGESIRTPRMLVLPYRGDRWHGQNLLRRFILAHHRPQVDGKPQVAPITWGNWGGTSAEVHLDNIRKIIANQLPIDYYWIDAGWYGRAGVAGEWWREVGSWTVGKNLYPNGFQPLSEALQAAGRKLMLWFEPERVRKDSDWYRDHHDWLLDLQRDDCLFDLGNPDARAFLIDFVAARIKEFGLGCYRQDFNMDPRDFWRAADAPDRQGMAEIRHIEGLYAFWDGLLARYPGLWIDNCASGGRRIDLETVGRATPFWRTDGPRDAVAHQCHTFGLMPWVPLSATSQDREGDDYEFRSSISSGLCVNWWHSGDGPQKPFYPEFPFAWGKRVLDQYLTLRPLYYGDYYPLTPWSTDPTQWLAWQFDLPETGAGMVQVFRRQDSQYEALRIRLRGLLPEATYMVTDLDTGTTTEARGSELAEKGIAIGLDARPAAALITYRKVL